MPINLPTEKTTMLRAQIEHIEADPTQFKTYRTTLGFQGEVWIDVPVPQSEVKVEKGKIILTLEGLKIFLKEYTKMVEQLHYEHLNNFK